ncbi:MAG: Daunorubicin/doxorubicin resistance ATP-binding protein DrrA [Alphaproteobacteria bacterium MarineAlpha11_Bin1]|nr:MAG: Daunorubicin/doxorubicin resistance ATP-binding protein DrrA [Alphaproteobacteria bacterium MarineAlpha11_Bin1]
MIESRHPDDAAIEVNSLYKTYAGKNGVLNEALKSINLSVPRGAIFGLLGPNGAGKSTLINILAGLVIKTSGNAQINGWDIVQDMRRARGSIGVVPQELNLDSFFTPRETMELQAGLYGVPQSQRRTQEIFEALDLEDKADVYARSLSGGMRRRLLVAKALVHSPPVVVLDEPTAGVDVELRQSLWEYMRELNRAGTTILLTTHYLEEAQGMCDQIAIINHGEIVAQDSTAALLARLDRKEALISVDRDIDNLPDDLKRVGIEARITGKRVILIRFSPSQVQMGQLLDAVRVAGFHITDLSTRDTDLEEIFISLTTNRPDGPLHSDIIDPRTDPLETSRSHRQPCNGAERI